MEETEIVRTGEEDNSSRWRFSKFPGGEFVFLSQVLIIYIVCCACLFNLSTGRGDSNLWSALLSGCMGYLLPNPTLGKR